MRLYRTPAQAVRVDASFSVGLGRKLRCSAWAIPVMLAALWPSLPSRADTGVEAETRHALARVEHFVTGRGVVVAVLDRGIDPTHPDFRNADGSTRIAYIFDLTDSRGAQAAGNHYGVGTIYTRAQIDAALSGGTPLATRDAVGHGTATAGNCCGNGRASAGRYVGVAPESTLIIVKFTSDGAPAHTDQAAEAAFYDPSLFPKAVDFAIDKARELRMPLVMLANFGSISLRADGLDDFAQKIDAVAGPGKPGVVFVTGTGDDGGSDNHASTTVANGQTVALSFYKGQAGRVTLSLWMNPTDRHTVQITTPTATHGPYAAPANNSFDTKTTADFAYGHNGSVYYGGSKRFLYFILNGPIGTYTLNLTGTTAAPAPTATPFEAYLSPSYFFTKNINRFLSFATREKTIWSAATARYNIAPNSYVFRTAWQGLNGGSYSVTDEGAVGDLWLGSSVGPTWDGRVGVDISAPGDRTITTYSPSSYWATVRGNLVADGAGLYGMASAVSAAAPLVTGAIALMLQKNPTADAASIKSTLQRTARGDSFTGAVPNPRFGYGKLDALAAVAATPRKPLPNSVSDCLFRWAEQTFPQFFSPAGASSANFGPYYFRYYEGTRNYLATSSDDNRIYLLGPLTADQVQPFAPATDYLPLADCTYWGF